MTLKQIAQQAMDYLDSVGVAAEYEIKHVEINPERETNYAGMTETVGFKDDFEVFIITDNYTVSQLNPEDPSYLIRKITECITFPFIPTKSPE